MNLPYHSFSYELNSTTTEWNDKIVAPDRVLSMGQIELFDI